MVAGCATAPAPTAAPAPPLPVLVPAASANASAAPGLLAAPSAVPPSAIPAPLTVVQVLPGYRYFYALLSDGTVRIWGGHSFYGRFPDGVARVGPEHREVGKDVASFETPAPVAGWEHVVRLDARGLCALGNDGTVACLEGAPTLPQQAVAERVACAEHDAGYAACDPPRAFGAFASFFFRGGVCATLADGRTSCLDEALAPRPLDARDDVLATREPCVLRAGGEVRCGDHPVFGLGSVQAFDAQAHGCAIRTNGTVACWQVFGHYGSEPGLGAAHDVATVTDARAIAVGLKQACAVTATHDLWCWALRGYYDNRSTSYDPPTRWMADVDEVVMGAMFGCARARDGRVACWGMNDRGQLGVGDERPRAQPTFVEGLPPVARLSAGADEVCAVGREGEVLCWGSNLYRAIGDKPSGAGLHVTSPMRVRVLP
jgi:hypothetical protein